MAGAFFSLPDWSCPPPGQQDRLQGLRSVWSDWLAAKHIPLRLRSHVQAASEEPLFTPAEVAELRALASSWFATQGYPSVSWEIPEFQLADAISDADVSLWPSLLEGVPTGIDADIPKSNVFIPVQQDRQRSGEELHVCEGNWQQATAQPELPAELVAKEAREGWIFSVPDMASARERWGDRVAIGKCNIVGGELSDDPGRKPRLIVDATVSGTNPSVVIPEKYSLPGLRVGVIKGG